MWADWTEREKVVSKAESAVVEMVDHLVPSMVAEKAAAKELEMADEKDC